MTSSRDTTTDSVADGHRKTFRDVVPEWQKSLRLIYPREEAQRSSEVGPVVCAALWPPAVIPASRNMTRSVFRVAEQRSSPCITLGPMSRIATLSSLTSTLW